MSEEHRNHACVLCRCQHRRHDGNCQFGQYFPSNRATDLENACRLFGLANLLRLMRCAEPSERQVMADSILTEANMWSNDPIHGALGHVLTLNNQIQSVERELHFVNTVLAQCSQHATSHIPNTRLDNVVAGSSHPGQSSTVEPREREGAAQEKDAEIKRKNKKKH